MGSSAFLRAGRSGARARALATALALGFVVSGCARLPWQRVALPLPPSGPTVEYRVKRGDTPERVAAWHGVDAGELRRMNRLDRGDALAPGEVLRVPARPLARYTLRPGDTLGLVGQWYGVDVDALVRLNDVADVRRLPVGRVITIPATATRDGRRAAALRPRRARAAAAPAVSAGPPPASEVSPAPASASEASLAPPPASEPVERELARANEAFESADFDGALAAAQDAERQLAGRLAPEDRRRLARAHLLAGMSQVALGREDEARRSFRAAVAADDTLTLDPAQTSPKVLGVFNEARAPE
jgi:LysM repeat protein